MHAHHETLVFERDFSVSPERVFKAYTDPEQRQTWSAPTPDSLVVIDETDVRTGGRERARCGREGDLKWTLKVAYHHVVPDELITLTEELWDGDAILMVALITFDLSPIGQTGAKLRLTDQITSFVGEGGIAGHREGYTQALANLSDLVSAH